MSDVSACHIRVENAILPRLVLIAASLILGVYAGTELSAHREDFSAAALRERLLDTPEGFRASAGLFRQALTLNAASAHLWCELGEAIVLTGEHALTEYCFLRGVKLAPNSPQILLAVGDFYVKAQQHRKALPYFQKMLGLTGGYDPNIFVYFGLMTLDIGEILEAGIPDKRAAQSYLRSVLAAPDLKKSEAVWSWMQARSFADRPIAIEYAQFLLQQRLPERAARTWRDYAGSCGHEYLKTTRVYNGGFECEPAGSPFDWILSPEEGAAAAFDPDVRHDGRASLRIRFDGEHNVDYRHATQAVSVSPGQYVLEAWIRSEDITTDQGVFLRVDPLNVATEVVRGTTAWTRLTSAFTVGPGVTRVQIQVSRKASLRFDNRIGGTVWIDSVRLWNPGYAVR